MFLNETIHPEANGLFSALAVGPDNYDVLVRWQQEHLLTDNQAAELYAFIEDSFNARPIHTISKPQAVSMLSRCLWKARVH